MNLLGPVEEQGGFSRVALHRAEKPPQGVREAYALFFPPLTTGSSGLLANRRAIRMPPS